MISPVLSPVVSSLHCWYTIVEPVKPRPVNRRLLLFVGETGITKENFRSVASHWKTLSHNVVSSIPRPRGVQTHNVSSERYWWLHIPVKTKYRRTSPVKWPPVRYKPLDFRTDCLVLLCNLISSILNLAPNWYPIICMCPVRSDSFSYFSNIYIFVH
jgi:hypothetical protein